MQETTIKPIGIIHSPFKEKFAVPRQAKLVEQIKSTIEIFPPYDDLNCFRGLEEFSHLWLIFGFNLISDHSFRALVRPPRLGGNKKLGVFATRSPFRPNNLGLSSVKLLGITRCDHKTLLEISGADLVDQTPIYDLKPYIKFTDAIMEAQSSYASYEPEHKIKVEFSEQAQGFIDERESLEQVPLRALIQDLLSYDPRPAYKNKTTEPQEYGFKIYDLNVKFIYDPKSQRSLVSKIEIVQS